MKEVLLIFAFILVVMLIIGIDSPTGGAAVGEATITVPLINSSGFGTIGKIHVYVSPGNGRVMIDINGALTGTDMQEAVLTASKASFALTEQRPESIDIVYKTETSSGRVDGSSLGASLAVATVAALENKTISNVTVILGTVDADGDIGWVSGVKEKAKASKDSGIKRIIIPLKGVDMPYYTKVTNCENACTTDYVVDTGKMSSEFGVEVVAVSNLREALEHILE
ncbi:MAG: S16 family serine protease [Candidatus Aenigmatarchaeota archaeon]